MFVEDILVREDYQNCSDNLTHDAWSDELRTLMLVVYRRTVYRANTRWKSSSSYNICSVLITNRRAYMQNNKKLS